MGSQLGAVSPWWRCHLGVHSAAKAADAWYISYHLSDGHSTLTGRCGLLRQLETPVIHNLDTHWNVLLGLEGY